VRARTPSKQDIKLPPNKVLETLVRMGGSFMAARAGVRVYVYAYVYVRVHIHIRVHTLSEPYVSFTSKPMHELSATSLSSR